MEERKSPILVTGAHRSGTTWIGRMLSVPEDVLYLHEPFHVNRSGICNVTFDYWFTYITSENEEQYYKPIKRMLELRYDWVTALRRVEQLKDVKSEILKMLRFMKYRLQGARPLIKDPIAIMSSDWLASHFDMKVVVLIRHPAAFAGSLKKANWPHPFEHFLAQPQLMQDHLEPFAEQIIEYAEQPPDIIDQACLLWRIIYHVVSKYQKAHPDWLFLRHEDISREPLDAFRQIYDRLDLNWTSHAQTVIKEYSHGKGSGPKNGLRRDSRANIWNWKERLTDAEIKRVRKQVADVSVLFYSDEDWFCSSKEALCAVQP